MPNYTLSPIPNKAKLQKEDETISIDWLNWFKDIVFFVSRLLNKYDNTKSGLTTLVAGTITIANTAILANTVIRLNIQTTGGTPGFLSIVLNPGVGFTINSTNIADTRSIFYEILEAF